MALSGLYSISGGKTIRLFSIELSSIFWLQSHPTSQKQQEIANHFASNHNIAI